MINEMLKVRDGRIRRILARTSTLSVTRNVTRGEAGLSNCGANGGVFQGRVGFKYLESLALDVVGRSLQKGSGPSILDFQSSFWLVSSLLKLLSILGFDPFFYFRPPARYLLRLQV